jgi:hypothetical protein
MSSVRAPLLLLLLLTAGAPISATASEASAEATVPETPPDVGSLEANSDGGVPTLETEREHLLRYTPVRTEGPACTSSVECAEKLKYGQVCLAGVCKEYEDGTDLFTLLHMTQAGSVTPKPFQLLPAILPAVGFNPALGFLIGVTAFLGMYMGDPATTTISNAQPTFLITSNKQIIFQMVSTIMTSNNDWELQGDYRFIIYNQDTYGLGTGPTPVSGGFTIGGYGTTAAVPGAQPMDFDLLRFHQSVLKRVTGNLYLGGALRFDRYYNINDELLNLSANPPVLTSHYAYSRYYGFNSNQYNIVSLGAEVLFDSRDSTINPYRGVYANFVVRGNPTWLGSSEDSTQAYGEFRTYLGLDPNIPRNLIAFWVIAQGVTTGALPYMALPAIGWDSRGRTGRGFVAGRLRGTAEVYAESEFRFRLTEDGFLGGVVFANVSTFARPAVSITGYSNPGEHLFQNLDPAGGFGLRFMMNRASRTNVTLDFAFSQTGFGIYLGAGEAF